MIRERVARQCLLFGFLALVATPAEPQAIPTGSIAGRVVDAADGLPLPGATVTLTSRNLQGTRRGVTSANGDYYVPSLPPGEYVVRVEIAGFEPFQESPFYLGASQSVSVNARLHLKRVEASAVVTARSEQVSTGAAESATYTSDLMNKLPVPRTLLSAVSLAPGVTESGPNRAVTISGAMSFENVMTVNGANIQENVRNHPLNLFIEDAIQETTIISSGISAEFGRFTGGVVNTVTKSGGNGFSGSFRATLNNDTWRKVTPFGEALTSGTLPTYEATLGGPFWKDRLWFFGAFRSASTNFTGTLAPPVSESFPRQDVERRYEGKLTLTPIQNQTLTGSYLKITNDQMNYVLGLPTFDMASVYDRQTPQSLLVVNYSGVLTESLFLEGQYSQRHFTFENSGSRYMDLINGTVLRSWDPAGFYNSPAFCAVCPGAAETRDNEEYFGKLNWFVSTKSLGSHNVIAGFDTFTGSTQSNNWQSGSSYFIVGNSVIYQGGDLFPVFDTGTYLKYAPIFEVAQPSSVKTISAFFNDRWKLNDHFSFNLGVRYDKNDAKDSGGVTTADDSKWSPRLAATWDPAGTGTFRVNATYAIYVGAPANVMVGAGSTAGSPAAFYYYYEGPPINTSPGGPLVTRAQAIQAVFDWFGITGPNQFPKATIPSVYTWIPGVNTAIDPNGLVSPSATEWTVGVGGSIGRRFTYRVDGVYRNFTDFYANYTNMSTGQVEEPYTGQVLDLTYVGNGGAPLTRKYYGLHSGFQWRPWDSLNIGGSWTWSHAYGNVAGEKAATGPWGGEVFSYPEYHDNAWLSPVGNLPLDQRHRVRLFGTWDIPFPKKLGRLSLGFLERLDTGLGYGAAGQAAIGAYVTNPGYATPPPSVTYYFTARDAFRTATMNALDLSLNYGINIGPVELFVQPQVINVFNGKAIVSNDASRLGQGVITAVTAGSKNFAPFNPFTTVPVQGPAKTGANWNYGANFGAPLGYAAYQTPLTFRISMGVRF